MVHIVGIIISLFLSTLLFVKRNKSKSDFVLACWLFLISFHLLNYYLLATGKYIGFPYFLGAEIPMPLLHGPFLWLYTALLTGKKIRKFELFHFLPAIVVYLALSKFFLLPSASKILVYQNHGLGYTTLLKIVHLAILPSGVLYIIMALLLLKKHRENIAEKNDSTASTNLNWLRNLIIGMGLIWLSILFGNDLSTFTFVDLFILFIGYFGVLKAGIFTNDTKVILMQETHKSLLAQKVKYQKSGIEETILLGIHQELTTLMQQEKLFKNPELSLNDVAEQLKIHANALSQVINSLEKKNFYDYINELRITEFKEIVTLPENQKFTLLSLAYEVGFNSKTSFNRNFKKITGLSPTAYFKKQQIQLLHAS